MRVVTLLAVILLSARSDASGDMFRTGMYPLEDYNLQGIVCNNRYCAFKKYGLRWAMTTTGEALIWQHKSTKYLKIGFTTVDEHDKRIDPLRWIIAAFRNETNRLLTTRGYYFKYCDSATQDCQYLGDKEFYTVGDFNKLFVPVLETRRSFPVDVAAKQIERRNKIYLAVAGIVASFHVLTNMTLTRFVAGAKNILDGIISLFWREDSRRGVKETSEGVGKWLKSGGGRYNRLVPKVIGVVGLGYFSYQMIKSWRVFSPEAYLAEYYNKPYKVPLFMAIPDMLVTNRREKLSISTIAEVFDATLRGRLNDFIASYQPQDTEFDDDEED